MKIRLTESLAAKITAVILSYVCVLVLAVSCLATVIMGYYKFYFSSVDTVKTEIMTDMAQDEAYHVENMLHWGKGSLESYYSDKNVWYEIIDAKSGEITDTNIIKIKIRDNGCGIENVEKAMEPLFTTVGGERAGLGFAVMQSFMDSIRVRSRVGKGTTVILTKKIAPRYTVNG